MNSSSGSFVYLLTHLFFHYSSYPFSQISSFLPLPKTSLPDPFLPFSLPSFFSSIHPSRQSSFCLFTCVYSFWPSIHLSNFSLCYFSLPIFPICPLFLLTIHLFVLSYICPSILFSFHLSNFYSLSLVFLLSLWPFLFIPSLSIQVSYCLSIFCPPIYLSSLFSLSFTCSHSLEFISFISLTGLLTLKLTQLHLSSLSFMIHLWVVFLGQPLLKFMRP